MTASRKLCALLGWPARHSRGFGTPGSLGLLRHESSVSSVSDGQDGGKHGDTRSILVSDIDHSSARKSGNSPVLLGLMNYLSRHVPKVGYFQAVGSDPFPHSKTGLPRHVELMHSAFGMTGSPSRMVGVTKADAMAALASGRGAELLDRVYDAYEQYKEGHDVVIVEGPGAESAGNNFVELAADVAASLGSPALLVGTVAEGESAMQLAERSQIASKVFKDNNVECLGLIANMVPPQDRYLMASQLAKRLEGASTQFLGAIPRDEILASIRLDEVLAGIGAKVMFGDMLLLDREVDRVYVASAQLDRLIELLEERGLQWDGTQLRPLLICANTRVDVILGMLAAHLSGAGPHMSAILMTGSAQIPSAVRKIVRALQDENPEAMLPILHTDRHTFDVANAISRIHASVLPTSAAKIEQSKALFEKCVNANALIERMSSLKEARMTPMMFMHRMAKRCQQSPQHIILPESGDQRVLQAAANITRQGIARITLLGDPEQVAVQAKRLGVDVSGCQVVDPLRHPSLEALVAAVVEARKAKGLTPEAARDLLADPNFFGTALVMEGLADGMVSGAVGTTANTIRPGLQLLRSKQAKGGLVSSVFFMCLPDKILVYGDCAVNVSPTPEQLAQIATTSADTAAAFGVEPRVALLSYSTMGSGSGPEVEKVTEAARLAKQARPDLQVEGPIQYDAAVDPAVAAVKIKTASKVAGRATVCIFPDLNTGNNTYKAVQQSTGAIAIGPVMQGLDKPVNDLSRGCTVADIVNTVQCTAIQALQAKERLQAMGMAP